MADENATNTGADDSLENDEDKGKPKESSQQEERPRDAHAGHLASQHRAKRDKDLLANQEAEGVEKPEVIDTLNVDTKNLTAPEHPDAILEQDRATSPDEGADAAAAAAEKKETDAAAAAEAAGAGDTEMVEIIVYGEKSMVPKSEVDEAGGQVAYQKGKAAEHQLTKANEILEKAQQTNAASGNSTQDQGGNASASPAGDGLSISPEDMSAAVAAIQDGTTEEGVEALQKILTQMGGASSSNDRNELVAEVYDRSDYDAAFKAFKTKFPEIMKDPKLVEMVGSRDAELRKNPEETRGYLERYTAIGEEMTEWLTGLGAKPSGKPAGSAANNSRQQRKNNADPNPQSAGGKKLDGAGSDAANNQPPARKTPRQTVHQMMESRGQT